MDDEQQVVGRSDELETIAAFVRAVPHGLRACIVTGPAGMGKSTLWRRGVELARAARYAVLTTRSSGAEAKLSYAGLTDLLGTLGKDRIAELPRAQRQAVEVALLRGEAAARTPVDARAIATGVLSVLVSLAATTPVLLGIDDAQWLDAATTAALGFALRRLETVPLGVLAAVRVDDAQPETVVDAVPRSRRRDVPLGPLSVASLHAIVTRELGSAPSRPQLVRISAATGGNPFHTVEISRELARKGTGFESLAPAEPPPLPVDLRMPARRRVARLPRETRDALLAAACLAAPRTSIVDAEALGAAEEAGIVRLTADGKVEFTHPLLAAAVYESASTARRRAAHAALAARVADPEERARHLALGTSGPDEHAARALSAAAHRARDRGAPEAAAELAELALALTPPGSDAALERRVELAEHLYRAGDFERGARLLEEVRATLPPGDLAARALLLLSELVYRRDGVKVVSVACAIAREALASADDPLLRARCHVRLAGWGTTSDVEGAAADIGAALALLDRSPRSDAGLRSFALANRVRIDLYRGRGFDERAARRAVALEASSPPRDIDDRAVFRLAVCLRYVDDFVTARARLAEAERAALDEGDESSLVNILVNRLALELWAGNRALTDELAAEVTSVAGLLAQTDSARVWIAYLDAVRGRLEAVRSTAELADRDDPWVDMLYLRALGLAELSIARYADADAHFSEALGRLETIGVVEPAIWRIRGDAVEAAVGAGDLARAKLITSEFERQAERSRIPWSLAVSARARGLVLAADGDLDRAAAKLEDALALHDGCPVPFERARTLLTLGRVRRRGRQKRLARLALEEARDIFDTIGAPRWADQAGSELARVTTRRAATVLTPTEERIARLAADGLTNRVIAERSFVAVSTVEANLKRVYRKLGISSRAQLGRALDEEAGRAVAARSTAPIS